ncbi:MAG: hypothetical protein ABFR75_03430 [Acidobacteriota bacterium]
MNTKKMRRTFRIKLLLIFFVSGFVYVSNVSATDQRKKISLTKKVASAKIILKPFCKLIQVPQQLQAEGEGAFQQTTINVRLQLTAIAPGPEFAISNPKMKVIGAPVRKSLIINVPQQLQAEGEEAFQQITINVPQQLTAIAPGPELAIKKPELKKIINPLRKK